MSHHRKFCELGGRPSGAQRTFPTKMSSLKNDAAELSKLKQAWREADAGISRGVKRQAEGLDSECLEVPLGEEVFMQINKNLRQHHSWVGILS